MHSLISVSIVYFTIQMLNTNAYTGIKTKCETLHFTVETACFLKLHMKQFYTSYMLNGYGNNGYAGI